MTVRNVCLLASLLLPAALAGAEEEVPASSSGKSDPACMAPLVAVPGEKTEAIALGARQAEVTGYKLTLKSAPDADHEVVIGVLASIGEASPENLYLLDRYLDFFKKKNAELIVVAGDTAETGDDIEPVLRKLGQSGLLVVAFVGNREHRPEFVAALEAVHKDLPNVVSGNKVREVDWDDATVLTLPGHFDARFLHRGRSCRYYLEDVQALGAAAPTLPKPVVLAAHSPPLGKGPKAIDVVDGTEHAGDVNLTTMIAAAKIPFGVFPNIKEAGSTATADVAGLKVLKQGAMSKTLYLNPGAADGVPWGLNDGSTSHGSVAILTIKGDQASYTMFKSPKITEAERKKIPGGGG